MNSQNVPSRGDGKITRMLFAAPVVNGTVELTDDNIIELPEISEVETVDGWKYGKDLNISDVIVTSNGNCTVSEIYKIGKTYKIVIR